MINIDYRKLQAHCEDDYKCLLWKQQGTLPTLVLPIVKKPSGISVKIFAQNNNWFFIYNIFGEFDGKYSEMADWVASNGGKPDNNLKFKNGDLIRAAANTNVLLGFLEEFFPDEYEKFLFCCFGNIG